ncbi:hypothetical protein POX_b03194 [Penicillium oxalicum]|uniref:hypothetical protein n=1 Tax=Penicillium oxalicum TaxID=69781 RepID=UPI0020B66CFE|nr:hypothetical protein POX_b03194 [Penicillium oxalicum]KAI2793145.1 hypothetical protein POX_b03194 [Penicillium oxalicum]
MLADSAENQRGGSDVPKLRTACENCRQSKVKCNISGKSMCTRCLRNGLQCQYGFANRSGKPKGSKNHATLRKLGELPDEKPPVRTFRSARNGTAAERRGSFSTRDLVGSNVDRTALENHTGFIPGPSHRWDSPSSLDNGALPVPLCSPLGIPMAGLEDMTPSLLVGSEYPSSPETSSLMTFDSPEFCMRSPPLSDSMPSPYVPLALCECNDMQMLNFNRLGQLLANPQCLRVDQSLQIIKTTFAVGQVFLQCQLCTKEHSNLLLLTSTLDVAMQFFERWVLRQSNRAPDAEPQSIRYGYYEVCQEEAAQIQGLLLRSLLRQGKGLLSMLDVAVTTNPTDPESLSMTTRLDVSQEIDSIWVSSEDCFSPTAETEAETETQTSVEWMSDGDPQKQYLLSNIAGLQARLDVFLRSESIGGCICGCQSTLCSS